DTREIDAAGDVTLSAAVMAARNLVVRFDRSTLQGTLRYTPPEAATRGRFEAQLVSDGLSVSQVPDLSTVTGAAQGLDLALTLDARNVRVGQANGPAVGAGRVGLRLSAGAAGLFIDTLDVTDLGGASMKASGRVGPAGGRLEATVDARRVEPLAELLGKIVPGRLPGLVADRAAALGPLRLRLVAERGPGEAGETRLSLDGTSGPSRIAASARIGGPQGTDRVTGTTRVESTDGVTLLSQLGLEVVPLPGFGRGRLVVDLDGRFGSGAALKITAEAAGTILTGEGRLGVAASDPDVSGSVTLEAADIAPLMQLLALPGPDLISRLPAKLAARAAWSGQRLALTDITGRFAGTEVTGRLTLDGGTERAEGALALDRLALPGLASLALGPLQAPLPGGLWPANRFGAVPPPPFSAQVALTARQLDLGGGWSATDASAQLRWTAEAFELTDGKASFLDGRAGGRLALRRQGGLANLSGRISLAGVPLARLAPASGLTGTADGEVDAAAAGETVSALVAGLAGGGQLRLRGLGLPRLAPDALARTAAQLDALTSPPDQRQVRDTLAGHLDRGQLAAGALDLPATLSAGVLRLGPAQIGTGSSATQGSLSLDLRLGRIDGRAQLQAEAPAGWAGPLPQALATWKTGRGGVVERDLDVAMLTNLLTTRVVARELEKIEAQESDLRERSFFARRMKSERDRLERDRQAAEEARLAEEARIAEEARRIEEARRAELARIEAEQRRIEAERRAEAQRLLDEQRRQEEARRAEEERQAELRAREQRAREEQRIEEARRAAEAAALAARLEAERQAELARLADEKRAAEA
ncbi:MAG: AsmA-like C-terminal region-containing protein, partial [Alsobacter sp.]